MTPIEIHQTLHGYDEGHELLAASRPLDRSQDHLTGRLSDLSGYLPIGTTFDSYLTGYPCGPWYALARTWYDHKAPRDGAVLTHTLLIPSDDLGMLTTLDALLAAHRRPTDSSDRTPYLTPLTLQIDGASTPAKGLPTKRSRQELIRHFFNSPERPILWRAEHAPEEAAAWLWSMLWPEARHQFAFCTFTVAPRNIDGRVFDFLALPDKARGAFNRLTIKGGAALETPWVLDLLEKGHALAARAIQWCKDQQLPVPHPGNLGKVIRLIDLEPAAKERISAARARAGLLDLIWPDLPHTHPVWADALIDILTHLDREETESWTWEWLDVLGRPSLDAQIRHDPRLLDALKRPLSIGLTQARTETLEAIAGPELLPLFEASESQTLEETLATLSQITLTPLQVLILRTLAREDRNPRFMLALLAQQQDLNDYIEALSWFEKDLSSSGSDIQKLLGELPLSFVLKAALSTDPKTSWQPAQAAIPALLKDKTNPTELANQHPDAPGIPLLTALLTSKDYSLRTALIDAHPQIAARWLSLLNQQPHSSPTIERTYTTAAERLPETYLWCSPIWDYLKKNHIGHLTRTLTRRLTPWVLQNLYQSNLPPQEAADAWSLPPIERFMRENISNYILRLPSLLPAGALPQILEAITLTSMSQSHPPSWVRKLIKKTLLQSSALDLESSRKALTQFLKKRSDLASSLIEPIMKEVLRNPRAGHHILLEQFFLAHLWALPKESGWLSKSYPQFDACERIASLWTRNKWPLDSLARLLDQDPNFSKLFISVCARHHTHQKLLQRLADHLKNNLDTTSPELRIALRPFKSTY